MLSDLPCNIQPALQYDQVPEEALPPTSFLVGPPKSQHPQYDLAFRAWINWIAIMSVWHWFPSLVLTISFQWSKFPSQQSSRRPYSHPRSPAHSSYRYMQASSQTARSTVFLWYRQHVQDLVERPSGPSGSPIAATVGECNLRVGQLWPSGRPGPWRRGRLLRPLQMSVWCWNASDYRTAQSKINDNLTTGTWYVRYGVCILQFWQWRPEPLTDLY